MAVNTRHVISRLPHLLERSTMTTHDDLAVIDAYMRDAAVRAVADAIRARTGELQLVQDHQLAGEYALSAPVPAATAPRVVTAYPVPDGPEYAPVGWWERHWPKVACAVFAGGLAVGLFWLITMAVAAVVSVVSTAIPGLLGLGALILLTLLLAGGRGGGGKSFSGTFQGRMH